MRTLKKSLSLVLVLAMVCSFFVMGTSAAFEDAADIDAKYVEAVEVMNDLKVLQGSNGEFNPEGTLTRAAAARIIVAMLAAEDLAKTAKCTFTDVPVGEWYYDEIAYCQSIGLMKGYGDGTVGPMDELTGAQFALMVMKAAGVDTKTVDPSAFELTVSALAVKEGLASVEEISAVPFTREMAAQLAFNGMNYVTEATYGYAMWKDVDGENDIDTAEKYTVKYYTSVADAAAAATALGAPWTYAVTPTPVAVKSLLLDKFGIDRNTDDIDAFGRPATSYTDELGNVTLYVDEPALSYEGVITNKALYATLGAKVSTYCTFVQIVDGVETEIANPSKYSTAAYATSSNGDTVDVYIDLDNLTVTLVVAEQYLGKVAKVTAATELTDRYVTVDGMTFETEEFAKNDMVIYTMANGEIQSMNLANTVSGTVEKHVDSPESIYTIDGKEYKISENSSSTISTSNVGKPVVLYVDNNGNIIGDKTVYTAANYLYILKVDTVKDNLVTGAKTLDVYGILSNGEYGIYTLDVDATNPVAAGNLDGHVYQYQISPITGNLVMANGAAFSSTAVTGDGVGKANTASDANFAVNAATIETADTKDPVTNSSTIFYFIEKQGTAVKEIVTKVGTANIGDTIASGKAIVVHETATGATTPVAKFVFVDRAFANAAAGAGNLVYATGAAGTTITIPNAPAAYNHTVYGADGEAVVAGYTSASLTEGLYYIGEGKIGNAATTAGKFITEINGNVITLDGATRLNVTDATAITYLNGQADLAVGQYVYYIVNPVATSNIAVMFVVGNATVGYVDEVVDANTFCIEGVLVPYSLTAHGFSVGQKYMVIATSTSLVRHACKIANAETVTYAFTGTGTDGTATSAPVAGTLVKNITNKVTLTVSETSDDIAATDKVVVTYSVKVGDADAVEYEVEKTLAASKCTVEIRVFAEDDVAIALVSVEKAEA